MSDLPQYSAASLSALSVEALIALLVHDEDRVPRNVIDECASRGEGMLDPLRAVLERGAGWEADPTTGEWWLLLHAGMILGLMPDRQAGELLVGYMRKMAETGDETLEEWLADRWAGLFSNKPAEVGDALRAIARDRTLDWYVRSCAEESILALAMKNGSLDAELARIAAVAADEAEDPALRWLAGSYLVDFPRDEYRALLLELARLQGRRERMFGVREVERAYEHGVDRPPWKARGHPWTFYDPEEIAERQQRWAEEEAAGYDEDDDYIEPYVREGAKVGRNDPCPCGSGKKYKRCCMPQ